MSWHSCIFVIESGFEGQCVPEKTAQSETPDNPSDMHGSSASDRVSHWLCALCATSISDISGAQSVFVSSAVQPAKLEGCSRQYLAAALLCSICCCGQTVLQHIPPPHGARAYKTQEASSHCLGDISARGQCGGPGCCFSEWSTVTGAGFQAPGPVAALQHSTPF